MEERGEEFYACFLDEKWFYTTSHRRKIKILPPGPGEDPVAVAHVPLTAVSRRHAIKVGTPPLPIDCCVIPSRRLIVVLFPTRRLIVV